MAEFILIPKKKAQAWGSDILIASLIFFLTLIIFFIYSTNQSNEAEGIIEDLIYEGKIISNDILSGGYPLDWNEDNVIKIGILTDNRINETKLEHFYNLAKNNYTKTKVLFNIKKDYYFFLKNEMEINGEIIDGIGKPGVNRTNLESKNLFKISRFVIYRNKPTTAYLYVFEN